MLADGAGPSHAGGPAGAAGPDAAGGDGPTRASTRVRKVAKAMARVDDDVRKQAVAARLEALECDNAAAEPGDDDSDDYVAADDMEGASRVCPQPGVVKHAAHSLSPPPPTPGITSRPKKAKGAKRTTRGQLAERKGPKPLSQLLEEARLDLLPPSDPSYLRAEQGPPQFEAPRRYCSVCGFTSTCVLCNREGMSQRLVTDPPTGRFRPHAGTPAPAAACATAASDARRCTQRRGASNSRCSKMTGPPCSSITSPVYGSTA